MPKPTNIVRIPYRPRAVQVQIHKALSTHRFSVLVTHRQLGKTVCAVNHLIRKALNNRLAYARYFYVAPFLKQAKLIAWDYLKRYTRVLPNVKFSEAELYVQLPNGARIWVCGADNPDALRGTYADGVVLDEYAQMKPDIFTQIIRPMLLSREGWVVFLGTPKGQHAFFELFNQAQKNAQTEPDVWWVGVYRADESGVIAPAELARLKQDTPDIIFRQEYLCDFTASAQNILIPIDSVMESCQRTISAPDYRYSPKIMGVDPARFGTDRSVIFCRQGVRAFVPSVFNKLDNMNLAGRVAHEIERFRPDVVFIDSGCGGGVIDRLRQLGYRNIVEIPFGSSASKPGKYANKRAEMWYDMAQWIKTIGVLPALAELKADLCQVCYDYDASGRLRLESKDKLKERTGKSPDLADALALTFAAPVRGAAGNISLPEFAHTDYEVL